MANGFQTLQASPQHQQMEGQRFSQRLLEKQNREVETENTWSLSHLVSTCFKAIYSSKSWWWQPITLSSTGATALPVAVQNMGMLSS